MHPVQQEYCWLGPLSSRSSFTSNAHNLLANFHDVQFPWGCFFVDIVVIVPQDWKSSLNKYSSNDTFAFFELSLVFEVRWVFNSYLTTVNYYD